jgi:hypothetical protein
MKNKLNHLFIGIFSLLSLTAFAGNKDAHQMLHASSKSTYLFEENKGQIKDQNWQPRPDVLFSGEANGLVHHVLANGISYQMTKVESMKPAEEHFRKGHLPGEEAEMVPDQIGIYRVDVRWVSNNPNMEIIKSNPSKDYNNYYNVPEGVEPALYVRKYEKITLKNVWQGIDLEYYSKDGILESDWIVHKASDLDKIKFTIQGADLSIDAEGNLVMQTTYGTIKEGSLKVFQSGKTLEASWKLNGEEVSFSVQNFKPELPLRIDPPTRLWGTYYGGSDREYSYSIATDAFGNGLVTGYTQSSNAIATIGAHQTTIGGGVSDAFIVQFNALGVRQWGTYYGGSDDDNGWGIAIDSSGNVLVTGITQSCNAIATSGSHQTTCGGVKDAFIVKLNTSGILQWGTYYGGINYDYGIGISSDVSNNILVTGYTQGGSAITTVGAHQTTLGGKMDAFIVQFNPLGVRQWSTYYGGVGNEEGHSITTDSSSNVFVTGYTSSNSSIATNGAHQTTIGAFGSYDAFVVKFNVSGVRQWGTYYGGSQNDIGYGITSDASGNVLITGMTESNNAIATNMAHQTTYGGGFDAFIVEFNTLGVCQWGTYYGGNGTEYGYGIASDTLGSVIVTGNTYSSNAIATSGAHQTNYGGGQDAYIVKFNTSGVRQWGTYYGGSDPDFGYGITTDTSGNVIMTGYTASFSDIASFGAHQTSLGGGYDAFIVKFQDNSETGIFIKQNIPLSATLFPNPASEQSYLQILAETNGVILLEISDLNGRVLSKDTESIVPGENCIQLNVQDFIPGIYFVTLTIDGYTQTLKFCKE